MEHENEEETLTLGGVVIMTAFCAATFVVGMGLGRLSLNIVDGIETRRLIKKHSLNENVTEIKIP